MKRLFTTLAIMVLAVTTISAQEKYQQDETISLWNNKTAPHSNGLSGEAYESSKYRLVNTTEAKLYYYKADESKRTGQAVVICPGGGYAKLSMDQEGYMMAQWLAKNGIAAFVLEYRLPKGHREVPLEDAVEAIRVVRKRAKKYGFNADEVGIMGFSAGGHLAASASTLVESKLRPNFSILFYPVIATHNGSFRNLLGHTATPADREHYQLHRRVDATTPPAILFHCTDDTTVPSTDSRIYHEALRFQGINTAMYIFPEGGHGWGIYDRFTYKKEWQMLLLHWLKDLKK